MKISTCQDLKFLGRGGNGHRKNKRHPSMQAKTHCIQRPRPYPRVKKKSKGGRSRYEAKGHCYLLETCSTEVHVEDEFVGTTKKWTCQLFSEPWITGYFCVRTSMGGQLLYEWQKTKYIWWTWAPPITSYWSVGQVMSPPVTQARDFFYYYWFRSTQEI
jgi:hypothetical protein